MASLEASVIGEQGKGVGKGSMVETTSAQGTGGVVGLQGLHLAYLVA